MKRPTHLLILLLVLSVMACWAQPALAGRLASVRGEAREAELRDEAEFKLSDQTSVEIGYRSTKLQDGCAVQVRVYREQNGRWLVVNTVLRTSSSSSGSRRLTLPAGSYRVQVIATQARFEVSVDK